MPAKKKRKVRKRKSRKRFVEAEDICRFRLINTLALSPDEKKIAYVQERVSDDKKKYFSNVFMYDLYTDESRQFTFGDHNDGEIVWSPDGKQIAFTSTRDKKSGIYIMSVEGGAERKLIEKEGSFSELKWTPDGSEIIYMFRYNDSHFIEDEKEKHKPPLYRHETRLWYRLDGLGFLPKDRFHIWKVAVADGKDVQLTKGKYDELWPTVSPDGKTIAFASNRTKNPDLYSLQDELFTMSIKGGKQTRVPTPAGPVYMPSFSPDGKKIAYLGHTEPEDAWGVENFHIWTVGIKGKPAAKDLVPKFDRSATDSTIGDLGEGFGIPGPVWSTDSRRLYFVASDNGSTHVFYVPARGGLPTRVTHKNCHVKSFSMNGKKKVIAAVLSDLKHPTTLNIFAPTFKGDKKSQMLVDPNADLFSKIKMPGIRSLWFKAHDGFKLQGWLVTPPDMKKNRKYPAILEIHGGPRAQYGFTFYHEMLFLASKGYIVFYTNPRGGSGRGETFAGSIVADWGSIDYEDCMAATDYLENLKNVNPKKMGVTGGSYGGYMTNWIVGHTNRFKAAVTQRSVVELKSFVGSSDMGYDLYREFDGFPWQNAEVYEKCSPLTYAKNIKTPLLIIHSEQDLRCGIEQAERLFATLKLMNKKVELVRFPEEPHGLSRHGRPDRRLARLDWILKWFKRYMK